jgi:hypothetical protein
MRDEFEHLLEDITLLTLTFAIALGWSLYTFVHGIALFIDGLLDHSHDSGLIGGGVGATWVVGGRLVTLDNMIIGLVEIIAVVVVIVLVQRRRSV